MVHGEWSLDVYAPNHQLHEGQRFWRDGTLEEAAAMVQHRFSMVPSRQVPSIEKQACMLADVRAGKWAEFAPGWPQLDMHQRDRVKT